MSDNLRQYRAIHQALPQCYPDRGNGRIAQHLPTLAARISGIVASRNSQLPAIATRVPDGNKPESRVKRSTRWIRNEAISEQLYFFPYAKTLLACLALKTLVLVIEGSAVGRGCVALMVPVVYKGRALPIGWLVRKGKKGHWSQALHLELVEAIHDLSPLGAQVVLLGDGAFDGTELQRTVDELGWSSVCRTAQTTTAHLEGDRFRLDVMGACLKPGTVVAFQNVRVTAAAYGPVTTICCWAKGYKEPLYLVSNLASGQQACRYYEKRGRIEPFFSDQKSRGFHFRRSPCSCHLQIQIPCLKTYYKTSLRRPLRWLARSGPSVVPARSKPRSNCCGSVLLYCGLDQSLREVAGTMTLLVQQITDSSIAERLTACRPWVKALLPQMLSQRDLASLPNNRRFIVIDARTGQSPGPKRIHYRLHIGWTCSPWRFPT